MIDEKKPRHDLAKHTPTPWFVKSADFESTHYFIQHESNGMVHFPTIAAMNTPCLAYSNAKADAEFIVRAVNSHDALLHACKLSLSTFQSMERARSQGVSLDIYKNFGTEVLHEAIRKATANE